MMAYKRLEDNSFKWPSLRRSLRVWIDGVCSLWRLQHLLGRSDSWGHLQGSLCPCFKIETDMIVPDDLPNDIAELEAIIRVQQGQNARLGALVTSFKKELFGAKSEKIDPAQYELELEDIETAIAQLEAAIDADERTAPVRPPKPRLTNRRSLPKHLERV